MTTFFQIKPPDIARDLTLANKLHKLARSLDNDAFVKRNLLALSDITSRNELKALINNFALNTADDHDELHHERKRRFFKSFFRKVKRWGTRTFNSVRAHTQRLAEAARKKALWLAQRAQRLALAAKRKALAFVNKIKNKFGGFKGVLEAFRMGFLNYFQSSFS